MHLSRAAGRPAGLPVHIIGRLITISGCSSPSSLVFPRFVPLGTVAANDTTCSNGFAGVDNGLICCDAACGVCGGATCGSIPGLTGADCCLTEISEANELCSVKGSAPCVIDPPGEFHFRLRFFLYIESPNQDCRKDVLRSMST